MENDKEIQTKLDALGLELKGHFDKAAEEQKTVGATLASTQTAIDAIKKSMDDLQKQTDAIDLKLNSERFGGGAPDQKSFGQMFTESAEFKAAKEQDFLALRSRDGRIRVPMTSVFGQRKSNITTGGIGSGTTGVQMPFRLPNITGLPAQELRIRDLMEVRTMTSGNSFDYVRQLARTNAASPQVEAATKAESTYTWEAKSDTVKTIAHFVNASRQAVDDIPWLQNALDKELRYGLLLKEESEILAGDGTGQHLNGLITQATAYDTGLNVSGDTKIDKLRHAKLQARLIGLGTFAPDGIVLSPTDMAAIELIKEDVSASNTGLYIVGNPRTGTEVKLLWGLPVVESDSIATGKFLVGCFGQGAELIDRMAAMVEISYEHANNFTQNIVTILCEERLGMAVRRPDSFIYGSL